MAAPQDTHMTVGLRLVVTVAFRLVACRLLLLLRVEISWLVVFAWLRSPYTYSPTLGGGGGVMSDTLLGAEGQVPRLIAARGCCVPVNAA